jgi:hypothetical protein
MKSNYCKTLIIREKFIFANIREFSKTRIHISREYFTLSIHLSENEHYPKMRTHGYISKPVLVTSCSYSSVSE